MCIIVDTWSETHFMGSTSCVYTPTQHVYNCSVWIISYVKNIIECVGIVILLESFSGNPNGL
jgi:hypothetical protein